MLIRFLCLYLYFIHLFRLYSSTYEKSQFKRPLACFEPSDMVSTSFQSCEDIVESRPQRHCRCIHNENNLSAEEHCCLNKVIGLIFPLLPYMFSFCSSFIHFTSCLAVNACQEAINSNIYLLPPENIFPIPQPWQVKDIFSFHLSHTSS